MTISRKKERYQRLLAQGICPRCGREPLLPGRSLGKVCHAKVVHYEETGPSDGRSVWATDVTGLDRAIAQADLDLAEVPA